jgi:hypothetical protein
MILCVKAMIPTISEDFQLLCIKGKMGIDVCGARTIPEFPESPHHCIPRWEKLVVIKAERGHKSTPSADRHFLWRIYR